MADVKIRIVSENQASGAIKQVEKDLSKMASAAEKTGKDSAKSTDNFIGSLKQLGMVAGAIGGSIAAFGIAAKKAFDMGREGAAIQQTSESFDGLLARLNIAPGYLDRLREASNNTIDDMSLMSSTLTLVAGSSNDMAKAMLGAAPQLLEIAKAANKLNPALGSTAFMYESIMTGIKRSSPLILDNLGLTLKVGEANEKYAEALGKSVEQLTAEEQKMALLNATLEAGNQLLVQVGGNTDSATDSYAQFETSITNLTNKLKSEFYPAITDVVKGINALFEIDSGDLSGSFQDVEIGLYRILTLLNPTNTALQRRYWYLKEQAEAEQDAANAMDIYAMRLSGLAAEYANANTQTGAFANKIDALGGPLSDAAYMVEKLHGKMREAGIGIADAAGSLDLVAQNASKAKSNLERLNNINLNFGSEISRQLDQLEYRGIGGEDFQIGVKAVMEDPQIPDSVRQKYLTEAQKIETALQIEAGNLGIDEAAQAIADDMGGSAEEVKGEIEAIQALLTTMSARDYWLDFVLNVTTRTSTTGNTGGGGGRGTGGRYTEQAGDFGFTVPPGYNNDTFLMGLTSGEQVDVTTRSGSQGGKQAQKGANYNYEFNITTNDPLAVANEVIAIINSQQRAATVAGAGYTGL